MENWNRWVDAALSTLSASNLLRSARPIVLSSSGDVSDEFETFDGPRHWDRSSVEVELEEETFREWLRDLPLPSGDLDRKEEVSVRGKMLLFSGNDYLGLSTHPTVRMAAAKAAREHGMGPRGSALICGYTDYHRLLEGSLADLKKKEVSQGSSDRSNLVQVFVMPYCPMKSVDKGVILIGSNHRADCLLCPTGFSANMAFMSALGSVSSLLAASKKPSQEERIAVFSDSLNHASIIDGIRLAERLREVELFIYRHCDMDHLNTLFLFSMDGDFAPLKELIHLRRKHGFLLVIDDAHASLVCGETGGGVPEMYMCESDVDICVGTLSKAAGCHGGFIACSNKWKQLIQSRGRSFIFSTSCPVPIAAASNAALFVGRKEKWRRQAIWRRVHEFRSLTGLPITSPIISIVIGCEESALLASRHMLLSGFHITAIRPPTVPPNSCRLRIALSAAHTSDDIRKLVAALSRCIKLPVSGAENAQFASKL